MSDDAPAPTLKIGDVLEGRYRLDAVLGEGGIGQVFDATQLALGTRVAIKTLRPEHAAEEHLVKRFRREAKALTELSHPHIVAVTDLGVADGVPYLVMEKVEGLPLSKLLKREVLPPDRALALTRQILRAVAHAHARGVVHRDLKPGNVVVRTVDGGDHATVLDFGLARYTGERGRQGTKLTRRGALIGTPAYMAPEQAAGGQADERADVYALGLLAYEMLAGRRPFLDREASELLRAHLTEPVPPLEQASEGLEVDRALEDWMQRALAKDRAERFRDAAEMLAALEAIEGVPARRSSSPAPRSDEDAPTPPDPTAATLPAGALAPPPPPPALPPTRLGEAAPAERSAGPPGPSPARAPLGLAVVAIAIVGVLLLAAAAGAILVVSLRSDDEVAPPPVAPAPAVVAPRPAPPASPAADPMAALPAELAPLHARVIAGRSLERSEVAAVNRYNREHPEDPRGHLLLGRHFTALRSLSWALPEYRAALDADPAARRWAPMLADLLEMVRSQTLHDEAVQLIERRYGAEALPAARAEREATRRPVEQRRLDALIARLEAAAPR